MFSVIMFLFYPVIVCVCVFSLAIFQICVSIEIKVHSLSNRIGIMHVRMLNLFRSIEGQFGDEIK